MIYGFENTFPNIHESVFAAESSDIIGQVTIEKDCSVWFGSVIRGDDSYIKLGEGTNIQDNCTIHTSKVYATEIGKYVTVGHGAIIHACKIGNYCLIGMGAIILDGADIGDYSIIGAGSLVTGRNKIPSGVLVLGSPAKVIRELSEEEKKDIRNSAEYYIKTSKRYK